jgi:hypothetical protein
MLTPFAGPRSAPVAERRTRVLVRERQLRAEAEATADRLVTIRRWQWIVIR